MPVEVIGGTNNKPAASRMLQETIRGCGDLDGKLYIGYPVISTHEGPRLIDALWASEQAGFVAFDLVEGPDVSGYEDRQEDFANAIESKLRSLKPLVRRSRGQRSLVVPVRAVTFAPTASARASSSEYPIANAETLPTVLSTFEWRESDDKTFGVALSALENISTIRRTGRAKSFASDDSRGAKLKRLEDSVATLDSGQARAVIGTTEGVQRIRGLAGSGKTIVLALKAAYLHAQHPHWRIAVTFHTRALKEFFRGLITNSFVAATNEAPDWTKLRIIHAWGAPRGEEQHGIYSQYCTSRGAPYMDFGRAKNTFGSNPFEAACRLALRKADVAEDLYDVILVDEAQDLPPAFLRICYELLTPEKRLVYAYDELQNVGQTSLPTMDEIFGEDARRPRDKEVGDIVLPMCYRNSRPVLATAHAMGFGIHRIADVETKTGIVQMFDSHDMWHDVGYRVASGAVRDGYQVALARSPETSPLFLEDHSDITDLVQFKSFETMDDQAEWVAEQIDRNVRHDEMKPEDIVVINPDPFSTAEAVGPIRALLLDRHIQSHVAGITTDLDVFREPDSVTFTGIYRAKGNEFGMVYVINAHDCYSASYNLARFRNRLFVAITRSKAWVRVCGVGDDMQKLTAEHERLTADNYVLRFVYPTEDQRSKMRIVHRDISDASIRRVQGHKKNLSLIADDLHAGRMYLEDLADMRPLLEQLLVREGRRDLGKT